MSQLQSLIIAEILAEVVGRFHDRFCLNVDQIADDIYDIAIRENGRYFRVLELAYDDGDILVLTGGYLHHCKIIKLDAPNWPITMQTIADECLVEYLKRIESRVL